MTAFWRDLVVSAIRNMTATLGAVMPSILAMLTLVALGAVLGWLAAALLTRLAVATISISVAGPGASPRPWPAPGSTDRRPRR